MSDKPRKTFGGTRKEYTVQFSGFDPVIPVFLKHTNNLKRARYIFDVLKKNEIDGGPAGEWELTLHRHNKFTEVRNHYSSDGDIYADHKFIYWVQFRESELIDRFSYMDVSRAF